MSVIHIQWRQILWRHWHLLELWLQANAQALTAFMSHLSWCFSFYCNVRKQADIPYNSNLLWYALCSCLSQVTDVSQDDDRTCDKVNTEMHVFCHLAWWCHLTTKKTSIGAGAPCDWPASMLNNSMPWVNPLCEHFRCFSFILFTAWWWRFKHSCFGFCSFIHHS